MKKPMTIYATYTITIVKHVYAEDNEEDSWEEETDKFAKELDEVFDEPLNTLLEEKVPYGCKADVSTMIEREFD